MIGAVRNRVHDRAIRRLALPALGALAIDPLVSLVDTAFVGRLGAEALAALAVASAVFLAVFAVFNFLEYAVTPLVANDVGAGRLDAAGRTTTAALGFAVVAGVVAGAVLILVAPTLIGFFAVEGAVAAEAVTYLRIRLLAMPAMLALMVGHGSYRGYQDTRTPLIVTVGLNVVNLVLDPLLIFGLDMGVAGAALATAIAQWLGAVWFAVLIFGLHRKRLGISLGRPERSAVLPLLWAGRSLIIRNAALIGALTITTAVAARVGTVQLAAHQIAVQVWVFLALVVDALAISGQAMVGKDLGSDDVLAARSVSDRLLVLGLGVGFAVAIGLVIVGPWIGGWFTSDEEVKMALRDVYPFLVIMQPLNALVFVWDGIAIGASAFRFLAWSMVGAAVVTIVLLIPVIPLGLGLIAVWWAIVGLMLTRAAALWWWYGHGELVIAPGPSPSSPAG